jgi:hypothetical protein
LRRVLRLFGLKREEVAGWWRRLHNEELHNLYSSPNIIRAIKLRRVRITGHVARIGYRILGRKPEGKRSLERHVDGRIILEWMLGKECGKVWTEFIWLRIGTSGGLL